MHVSCRQTILLDVDGVAPSNVTQIYKHNSASFVEFVKVNHNYYNLDFSPFSPWQLQNGTVDACALLKTRTGNECNVMAVILVKMVCGNCQECVIGDPCTVAVSQGVDVKTGRSHRGPSNPATCR